MTRRSKSKAPTRAEGRRCGVYTRKSTAAGLEQEFNTLEAQYEACQRYVAGQPGWRVVPRRYDDGGFTGANLDRPAFRRLLTDIDAGEIDVVVVYKVDRLSRSLLDFAQVMDRFNRAGAAFVSVTQNFSTADAIGRLTLHMLMSFAEFERSMISERTRDKVHASRRKGKWTGGIVPLGYALGEGRLVVDEVEAVVVRETFDLYEQHGSAVAVASLLNAKGRTTKHHRANNGNVRRGVAWTKNTVLHTLRNPLYAGYMTCGPEELNEGEHEAVIDRQRWHAMCERLGHGQAGNRTFARNPEYLLRGILKCGACGKAMTPTTARGRKGVPYRYYRCITRDKQGARACTGKQLPAPAIEEFIIERLREAIAAGDLVADVHARLAEWSTTRRVDLESERKALRAKLKTLSKQGKSLVESLTQTSGKARRLLEDQMNDPGDQVEKHESRLQEIDHVLASLDQAVIETQWVAEMLSNFDVVWDAMTLENRGRLMRAIVERVEVDEASNQVTAVLVDLSPEVIQRGKSRGDPEREVPKEGEVMSEERDGSRRIFTGYLRRTRGRACAFTDQPPPPVEEPKPRPAKVALAHRIEAAIERGEYRDRADVARQLGLSRARITQITDLALLAPDLQECILCMVRTQRSGIPTESELQRIALCTPWESQRVRWRVVLAKARETTFRRWQAHGAELEKRPSPGSR